MPTCWHSWPTHSLCMLGCVCPLTLTSNIRSLITLMHTPLFTLHIPDTHTPMLDLYLDTHIHTQIHTYVCIHTCTHNSYPTVPGPPTSMAEGCTARWAR